jgi:hypothetical protein
MTIRKNRVILAGAVMASVVGVLSLRAAEDADAKRQWTEDFGVAEGELTPTGRNPYFILEPGYQLVFEGKEKGKPVGLTITVLDETKKVDNVTTRIVEERETKEGQVIEVSRNFFAISQRTNSVYYFGEEADIYRGGKVVSHEGAWLSGVDHAKFGLVMPGTVLLGARYYQEVAPGKAMDRAEIMTLSESLETPAGKFAHCLKVEETTPLEPDEKEFKYYAAGVGLLKDGPMKLVRYGLVPK